MKKLNNTKDAAVRTSFINEFAFGNRALAMEALINRAHSIHLPYDDDDSAIYAELEKSGEVDMSLWDTSICLATAC